jgi:hypothetical protein
MIFQPADKFHGALSEPLDGLLEFCRSAVYLAREALEQGSPEDLSVVAIREILKKIPTALKQAQTTADTSF